MIDQPTLSKDMYSPSEVARLFGVSKRTVLRWIASGQIGGYRISYTVRIARNDLETFMRQHRFGPGQPEVSQARSA